MTGGRRSALRPWAKALLALGTLASLLGAMVGLAAAPPALAPYALPIAVGGLAALGAGLLLSGFGALEQRLIDAELTLIETREQLKAAVAALDAPQARGEPTFRSRPAARRRIRARQAEV